MKLTCRPVVLCCICFVLSIAIGYCFLDQINILINISLCTAVLLLVAFIVVFANRLKSASRTLLVFFFCSLLCIAALLVGREYFVGRVKILNEFYNSEVSVCATVTEVKNRTSYSASYKVSVDSINENNVSLYLLLDCEGDQLRRGERFLCTAVLSRFEEISAGFSEKTVYESQGMRARLTMTEGSLEKLGEDEPTLFDLFDDMRDYTIDRFASFLSPRGAALFSGAFAGDRSYISDYDNTSVIRSGTSHLLAVSGMHLSVVVGLLWFFLSSVGVGVRLRYLLLVIFALIYALFTGFSPSVVRSLVMLSITYIGASLGRESDAMTSLWVAVVLMLSISPNLLFSASFWLSVSATLGILLVSPVVVEFFSHRHRPMISDVLRDDSYTVPLRIVLYLCRMSGEWLRALPSLLFATFVCGVGACVFSVPFSLLFFGNISYSAIPCGILLSFIVSLTLTLSPVVLLLCQIPIVSAGASLLGEAFFTITHFFSSFEGVYINAQYLSVYILLVVFFVTVVICLVCCRSKKPLLCLCLGCYVLLFVCAEVSERVEYSSMSAVYTEGECLMLRLDDGLCAIDMGSGSISVLRRSLSRSGILRENDVSAFVFTHLSSKHEKLVRYLLTNYRVEALYFPDYASEHMALLARAGEEEAELFGVPVHYYRYGEKFRADGVRVEVSELEYLDRSASPLFSVSVDYKGAGALWLSSSFFEGDKRGGVYDRYYDWVILGSYGPIQKDMYPVDLFRIPTSSYVTDRTDLLDRATIEPLLQSSYSYKTWYLRLEEK